MPIVFITYSLAYLDRTNYGFGAAAGLNESLGISPNRAALLSSLFFLGYFAFQVPAASYARRHSPTKMIFGCILGWGVLASLTGVINSFWLLAADRFLLGSMESLIVPAMLILLTHWFSKDERSRANTYLILGNPATVLWMSVITGYLIAQFGWRDVFIIEGLPSVLWAFVWLATMSDGPKQARWLSDEDRAELDALLNREQRDIAPASTGTWATLADRRVMSLSLQLLLWSVTAYGFIMWLPDIIHHGGAQSMGHTGLLAAGPYAGSIVLMIAVSIISDRFHIRKHIVWPLLLASALFFLISFLVAGQSFAVAYACMVIGCACMQAPLGPFFAIPADILPRETAGVAMGIINSAGALGGFLGSWIIGYIQARTHSLGASFAAMSLFIFAAAVLMALFDGRPSGHRHKTRALPPAHPVSLS
jgi:MFS family permease